VVETIEERDSEGRWLVQAKEILRMIERGEDVKIEVVYEGGVFRPLGDVKLEEGTEALVVIKPRGIVDVARRHRIRVDRDLLEEFVEERR
jgi:predicted DNA-binding antitoxin AbrB/MazE fold protein